MSTIDLLLTDRASLSRGTSTIGPAGNQIIVWSVIAIDVPASFVRESYSDSYADLTGTSNKAAGSIYFSPDADVKPGDVATLSNGKKYTLLAAGGPQLDFTGQVSHFEFAAKETA